MSRAPGQTSLVTGVTGLIGGALVLELLERTDDDVICLVRGTDDAHAHGRAITELSRAARLYGQDHLRPAIVTRVRGVAADVALDGCGVDAGSLPGHVDYVWHCAASLKYHERDRDEIRQHNVGGTRNVLRLARSLNARELDHVSTAYVAGTAIGRVLESPDLPDGCPNNAYEDSKREAESLLHGVDDLLVRVLRPSIVVGHSRTLGAATFSGIYTAADRLVRFRAEVDRLLPGHLADRPVMLRGRPDLLANLIPVDSVVGGAVDLHLAPAPAGVFHLASTAPPSVADVVTAITRGAELLDPVFTEDASMLSEVDQALDRGLSFQRPYMTQGKDFDCTRSMAWCRPGRLALPLSSRRLVQMIDHYFTVAEQPVKINS